MKTHQNAISLPYLNQHIYIYNEHINKSSFFNKN